MAHTIFVPLCFPKETLPKLPCPRMTPTEKSLKAVQGSSRPGRFDLAVCGACVCTCMKGGAEFLEVEFCARFELPKPETKHIQKGLLCAEEASSARVSRPLRSYDVTPNACRPHSGSPPSTRNLDSRLHRACSPCKVTARHTRTCVAQAMSGAAASE